MVKTITIRDEVYERLKKMKREGDSFSDLLGRVRPQKALDIDAFFGFCVMTDSERKEYQERIARMRKDIDVRLGGRK